MNAIVPPGIYFPTQPEPDAPLAVATSTAGFIGYGHEPAGGHGVPPHRPVLVRSWLEFRDRFGNLDGDADAPGCLLARSVRGFFLNGGQRAYVVRVPLPSGWAHRSSDDRFDLTETDVEDLLGLPRPGVAPGIRRGMAALETCDEVCVVAIPDLMAGLTRRERLQPDGSGRCPACGGYLTGSVVRCPRCKHRGRQRVEPGSRNRRMSLLAMAQAAMVEACERAGDRIAVLDSPPGLSARELAQYVRRAGLPCERGHATMYYPWLHTADGDSRELTLCPPSGHVAGAWARNDEVRGVHYTPANLLLEGVVDLDQPADDADQSALNTLGVNVIRAFPGRGVQIWGARTLACDSEWRYLAVRRVMTYIRKAVEAHMQWLVFEPNDPQLWDRITDHLSAFLTGLWRAGRIAGATPEEGFLVRCDESLNPVEGTNLGRVITEIRVAPLKPAEFLVFRLQQVHGVGVTSYELATHSEHLRAGSYLPALVESCSGQVVEWLPTTADNVAT